MVSMLFVAVVLMGAIMALRPKQVTRWGLGRHGNRYSEGFLRHYALSVRLVGIGWILFVALTLAGVIPL